MHLNTAPPVPANFIPRPDEFNQLIMPLLDQGQPSTVAITTALQGGVASAKRPWLKRFVTMSE